MNDDQKDLDKLLTELQSGDGGEPENTGDSDEPDSSPTNGEILPLNRLPADDDTDQMVAILQSVLGEFDQVGKTILDATKADRDQTQEVITLLLQQLRDNPAGIPRASMEGLVKALDVKANISMIAVKLLDVKAKLLATTKNNNILINNNQVAGDQDLNSILSQPRTGDFDEA